MNYLVDYHIHSIYSTDGHNTIMEICESAVSNGIGEIAIIDHLNQTLRMNLVSYNQIGTGSYQ